MCQTSLKLFLDLRLKFRPFYFKMLNKQNPNQSQENHCVCTMFHFSGHRKHIPADGARNLYMILVLEYHTLWQNTFLEKESLFLFTFFYWKKIKVFFFFCNLTSVLLGGEMYVFLLCINYRWSLLGLLAKIK